MLRYKIKRNKIKERLKKNNNQDNIHIHTLKWKMNEAKNKSKENSKQRKPLFF